MHVGALGGRTAGRVIGRAWGVTPRLAALCPVLLVAAIAVVRWLSLTTPVDRGMGPLPQTGPAAPAADSPTARERRSGESRGFGRHRWPATVGPGGASVHPCDRPNRDLLPGEGGTRPVERLAPGTVLPVHAAPGAPPRWARVEDLHLIDMGSTTGAPDATDGLLLKELASWSPGGVLVPLRDLRPAVPRDLSASDGPAELTEFTRGLITRVKLWQGGQRRHPVVLVLYEARDPEVPLTELQLSAYRVDPDGSMTWLAGRTMLGHPLSEAAVSVCPTGAAADAVPDIIAFVPPLGPVCWRWNGERYRRGLPTASQAAALAAMTVSGLSGIIALTACLLVLIAGGWRLSPETRGGPGTRWALAASASLWVWSPPVAFLALLPGLGVLWWVGVRPALTPRGGPAWLLTAVLSPVVFAIAVMLCLSAGRA